MPGKRGAISPARASLVLEAPDAAAGISHATIRLLLTAAGTYASFWLHDKTTGRAGGVARRARDRGARWHGSGVRRPHGSGPVPDVGPGTDRGQAGGGRATGARLRRRGPVRGVRGGAGA